MPPALPLSHDDLRARFAGQALSGILSRAGSVPATEIARRAVDVADALIAELERSRQCPP